MQKRTFPSLIPVKGAGSVVYSRECFIPVRGTAFLFPLSAVQLWELTQHSGCSFPVGLLSSVTVDYSVSVNGVCMSDRNNMDNLFRQKFLSCYDTEHIVGILSISEYTFVKVFVFTL